MILQKHNTSTQQPVYVTVVFAILLLFSNTLFGQTETPKLTITPLTDDFYVYTTYKDLDGKPFPSNSMYVVSDKGVILIDTPWDESDFQPLLDSIYKRHQKKVVLCIATHFHDDSSAGLDYYKKHGIPTYTSKLTHELSVQEGNAKAAYHFEKDTVFTVGNKKFETFYPGAGHTQDNIVVWFEKEKVLYGGCLIKSTENNDLGYTGDADIDAWEGTMKKLINKYPKPSYVIPGHFAWDSPKALQHTLKLVKKKR